MNLFRRALAIGDAWTEEFGPPSAYDGYHIYSYEWIDRLSTFEDAQTSLSNWSLASDFLEHFRGKFREAGWKGDGTLQIYWLPPFAGVDAPTTGFYILHVKQMDDGISWIASRYQVAGLEREE